MTASQEALRISQLDAAELDTEVFTILKNQFRKIFQYFGASWLVRYDPEFNAALKFVLWKYTISSTGQTIGQRLFDLKYKDTTSGDGGNALLQWMSRKQRIFYLVLLVIGPWITQRTQTFRNLTQTGKYSEKFWNAVGPLEIVWDVASLINFLVFLVKGKYQFIIERVLGIRSVFPRPHGIRQVGFEYMDRELLWHGFAEFLFFALPLVNIRRIKNFIMRNVLPNSVVGDGALERVPADMKECIVCGEWPFNPQEIGCKHVFCYYCIQANVKADPGFCCPACGNSVMDSIKPVRIRIEAKQPVIQSTTID